MARKPSKTYPHTVLIVSHDRDLLNRAVGSILHLDKGKLTLYTAATTTSRKRGAKSSGSK